MRPVFVHNRDAAVFLVPLDEMRGAYFLIAEFFVARELDWVAPFPTNSYLPGWSY